MVNCSRNVAMARPNDSKTCLGNPFVVSGYGHLLWIADYGGTDTLVVDPRLLAAG